MDLEEERARKLGMELYFHVNVNNCYIKNCIVPTNFCVYSIVLRQTCLVQRKKQTLTQTTEGWGLHPMNGQP